MTINKKLSEVVTSYLDDNKTNPRQLAKEIGTRLGMPDAINYNTIRNWSKGEVSNPYKAAVFLPLLQERGGSRLGTLAGEIMTILEISQPVQS